MKIDVKGTKYKIVYKKLENEHGLCDREKKIIYIDTSKETQPKMHRSTITHELVHAYMTEMYIDVLIPIQLEEIICEMVANMFEKHADLLFGIDNGPD